MKESDLYKLADDRALRIAKATGMEIHSVRFAETCADYVAGFCAALEYVRSHVGNNVTVPTAQVELLCTIEDK